MARVTGPWALSGADGARPSRYAACADGDLAERAIRDTEAFDELYRRYANQLFWYLLTRTTSPEDAADLTQQVFLRALEALPGYRDRGLPFRAWLLRIARNMAVDEYRRQRAGLPWDHGDTVQFASSEPGPESAVLLREDMQQLRALIARLDPETREILAMRFAGKFTVAEIAAATDRSEAAVKKQLQRLMRWLREHWDGE